MTRQLVVIGASWGGVNALRVLLAGLPPELAVPVVVVLHRSPEGGDGLTTVFRAATKLVVMEARDKQPLEPGHVYIAPADYHLLVEPSSLALSVDEPVSYARPSVDVLFESAADAYGSATVGVILTGSGSDGARGMLRLQKAGALTVVQDPATAENRGMPDAALLSARVDQVLPLEKIAAFLVARCGLVTPPPR